MTAPFLTDEFQSYPTGVVARIRSKDPVHFIPELGAWMITKISLRR